MADTEAPDQYRAARLARKVTDAWSDIPHPGEGGILDPGARDFESVDVAKELDGRSWDELDFGALSWGLLYDNLTPAAERYYIQAYLCYCLDIQTHQANAQDLSGDYPTIQLIGRLITEAGRCRTEYSFEQARCIHEFLAYVLKYPRFYGIDDLDPDGNAMTPQVQRAHRSWKRRATKCGRGGKG